MRLWILSSFFLILASRSVGYTQTATDSLLNRLDAVLAEKQVFIDQKLNLIALLDGKLKNVNRPDTKYALYQNLYDEYKAFRYDSAYSYAKKLEIAAGLLADPGKLATAKMNLAFTLISSGMFKETLETLNAIDVKLFSDSDKIAYYFLKGRSYFDLSDFDRNPYYSAVYDPLGIACIDSALKLSKSGLFNFLQLRGLKALRTKNYQDGVRYYTQLLNLAQLTPHQYAVNAASLSYIYEIQGDEAASVNLLIKAAICDLQSVTEETVALYKVANYLYKKGDLKRADAYISEAMDEATFYGARQRQAAISGILPIIEAQRIRSIEQQRRSLLIYSSIITLLVLFVRAFAYIIFRQLKRLRLADEIIKTANITLQGNNKSLEELNKNLSTANKIKNEYIGYYFNINSIYIEKLESFQKSLEKKINSKRFDDASAAVKNLNFESERLQLFHTFDEVFIKLFPDFINKFNRLFNDGEEMLIPEGQLLSTEHRIFALIRMGIHDNDRIARLLGYSVNTIYSYKNRIKNKSYVPNDEFEERIMQIEAV
jgi:DNA-binding CsgD family transcriptional regulator